MLNSERMSFGAAIVPAYCFPALGKKQKPLCTCALPHWCVSEVGQYQWDGVGYTSREFNAGISFPVIYRSLAPGEQKASFLNISMGGEVKDGTETQRTSAKIIGISI